MARPFLVDLSLTLQQLARFWSYVVRAGDDECWVWLGGKSSQGYARVWFNGRGCLCSRVVWILTYGVIPDSRLFVCHSCDNPLCCNPMHLFLGTPLDNMRDAVAKGRVCSGERRRAAHANAKKKEKSTMATEASTYRFDLETRALMDRLAEHFEGKYGLPCSRAAVIRLALARLAEQELPPDPSAPRR